jgi:hypothetical protein
MHGPMLERLANHFRLKPTPETVVPESLALGNSMIALARHRRYAYHSIGGTHPQCFSVLYGVQKRTQSSSAQ